MYYCANVVDGDVTDHIVARQADLVDGIFVYQPSETVMLAPGGSSRRHVCDPAILAGKFTFTGEAFVYVMFFTGEDIEGGPNSANDLMGPWTMLPTPIISAPGNSAWGVGQPSATSVDGQGKLLLFYSRGTTNETSTRYQYMDLSVVDSPIVFNDSAVPLGGLVTSDGTVDSTNHDNSITYDAPTDTFWMARVAHPFPASCPDFISSSLQLYSIPGSGMWEGTGKWTLHAQYTQPPLPWDRLFDPGLIQGVYGTSVFDSPSSILASVSWECDPNSPDPLNWLWNYRIQEVTGTMNLSAG
ncbi:carbohydrate-binding protein [Pelomyxa schiedti]|nr:carbohydrate-binding protein [Pelomyxa schiedti]